MNQLFISSNPNLSNIVNHRKTTPANSLGIVEHCESGMMTYYTKNCSKSRYNWVLDHFSNATIRFFQQTMSEKQKFFGTNNLRLLFKEFSNYEHHERLNPDFADFLFIQRYESDVDYEMRTFRLFESHKIVGLMDDPRNSRTFDGPLLVSFDNFAKIIQAIKECLEDIEQPDNSTIVFCAPLWFIGMVRGGMRMFERRRDLIEYFSDRFYIQPTSVFDQSLDFFKTMKGNARVLDLHLQNMNLQRKLEGQKINHVNLIRALDKAKSAVANGPLDMQQNNNLRVARIEANLRLADTQMKSTCDEISVIKNAFDRIQEKMDAGDLDEPRGSMDMPEEVPSVADQSMNTALATTTFEARTEIFATSPDNEIASEIITDISHDYPDLTERWINFDSITLDTTITRGSVIAIKHLPADFVIPKWNTPNMLPFRLYEFWSGGLDVKLQWNLAKTNQFALAFGIVYHWLERDRRNELINVHTISQMPGGRLNGHVRNSDIVSIDWASYAQAIPIRPNSQMLNLYNVSLFVIALTDFEVSDGGVSVATLNLYARFHKDLKFFGQRFALNDPPSFVVPTDIEEPIEGSMMAAIGASVGKQLVGSANAIVKSTLMTATKGVNSAIESTISQGLPAVFGNRDKPTSSENCPLYQRTTTNIASGDGHFESDSFRLNQHAQTPHPPAILGTEKLSSVLGIMEIEGFQNSFRVPVSAAQGDLLCSMRAHPAILTPLSFGAQFPNNVVSWTPVDHMVGWFRNYHGKIHLHFECVVDGFKTARLRVCYVPNYGTLTYEQSDSVYYKIFDLGASLDPQTGFDFEIPYIHGQANYQVRSNGGAYLSGSVHVFLETVVVQPEGLVDHFDVLIFKRALPGQFNVSVPRNNVTMLKANSIDLPDPPPPPPPGEVWHNFSFVIVYTSVVSTPVPDQWTGIASFVVAGTTMATRALAPGAPVSFFLTGPSFWRYQPIPNYTHSGPMSVSLVRGSGVATAIVHIPMDNGHVSRISNMSPPPTGGFVPQGFAFQYQGTVPPVITISEDIVGCMDIRHAQDENLDLTRSNLEPFIDGLHGESFHDLYANVRRFQQYDTVSLNVPSGGQVGVFRMSVNYGGAYFRDSLNTMQKTDKLIQLHDAFRFARGGVRYLISATGVNGILTIQHYPQVNENLFTSVEKTTEFEYTESGYGEVIMSLQQNNVIPIEVPMYIPNLAVLNASYLSTSIQTTQSNTLGQLRFFWQGDEGNLILNIKRAAADDFHAYCFNGFPPREVAIDAGAGTPFSASLDEEILGCMMSVKVTNPEIEANIAQMCSNVNHVSQKVTDFIEGMSNGGGKGRCMISLLTQIGHVVNNPKLSTFVLSTVEILSQFHFLNTTVLESIGESLSTVWDWINREIFGSSLIDDLSKLSSILISGVVGYFDPKACRSRSFTERLTLGASAGVGIRSRMTEFIREVLEFLKSVIISVCDWLYPDSQFLKWLREDTIQTWLNRVRIMTDETVYFRISESAASVAIVYRLVLQGEQIQDSLSKGNPRRDLCSLVNTHMSLIRKLRDKLALKCKTPRIKLDPYCWYISGASHIGKSYLMDNVSRAISEACLKDKPKEIFVVPESLPYWDSYNNEKILHFDDFMRTPRVEAIETDVSRLCGLKGNAPFIIPKAFEDKACHSIVELIGCASNMLYPKVNGMLQEVVLNRRNIVWEVKHDFSRFQKCDFDSEFRFGCATCMDLNSEQMKTFDHLRFIRRQPNAVSARTGPRGGRQVIDDQPGIAISYEEFLRVTIEDAKLYFRKAYGERDAKLAELRQVYGDNSIELYRLTASSDNRVRELISDGEFSDVIAKLGGVLNNEPSGSMFAMLRGWRSKMDEEEIESEDVSVCLHNIETINASPIIFYRDRYVWPDLGLDNGPCGEYCEWHNTESTYLRDLEACYRRDGCIPRFFPKRFIVDDNCQKQVNLSILEIERKPWYSKYSGLMATIGAAAAVIGVGYLVGKIFNVGDKISTKIRSSGLAGAMMASGDVRTKFTTKLRTARPLMKMAGVVGSQMEGLTEIDYRFNEAVCEIIFSGEDNVIAKCVQLGSGVYVTQMHALLTIMTFITKKVYEDFASCTCGTEPHRDSCVGRAFSKHPLRLRYARGDGSFDERTITLKTLLDWNNGSFAVDPDNSDLVMLRVELEPMNKRTLKQFLVSERTNQYVCEDSFSMIVINSGGQLERQYKLSDVVSVTEDIQYAASQSRLWVEGDEKAKFSCFGYRCRSPNPGAFTSSCGSLLVDRNTMKIIGILSASSRNYLWFNAVSLEQVAYAETILDRIRAVNKQIGIAETKSKIISIDEEGLEVWGSMPRVQTFHSTKTTLRKSPCFEQFGSVVREPSEMSQEGDRGQIAISEGLKNYQPHQDFEPDILEEIFSDVNEMFMSKCLPIIPVVSQRKFSEAVCGIEGHIPSMTMSTGPGYPWCLDPTTKRKSDLIKFDENHRVVGVHEDLLLAIKEEDEKMRNSVVPLTVHFITLKDELLPPEKTKKVRLIQGSPLSLTISARKYLMDFNYAFQCCRNDLEHAVGMNPFSMEWDAFTRSLVSFSPYICVGDYSKFGPRLSSKFVRMAYKIMTNWYGLYGAPAGDQEVRRIIGERCIDSFNACFDVIVKVKCGSPSGAINTVVVNSICNMLYIRAAWIGLARKHAPELQGLHRFADFVKFFCYGDDVIFAVKEEVICWFNSIEIEAYFRVYDLKYTDITKDGKTRAFCGIEDATFLKCGFRRSYDFAQPCVWLPVMDIAGILDTTNWVRKPKGTPPGADMDEIMSLAAISNCEDAVRKLWFHGEDVMNTHQSKINSFWRDRKTRHKIRHFTWRGLAAEYGYILKDGTTSQVTELECLIRDLGFLVDKKSIGRACTTPNDSSGDKNDTMNRRLLEPCVI